MIFIISRLVASVRSAADRTSRYSLILFALCLVAGVALAGASMHPGQSEAPDDASVRAEVNSSFDSLQFFRGFCAGNGIPYTIGNNLRLADQSVASLTLDGDLQAGVREFLEKKRVPYAVFVAVEPKSGRVLANIAYSAVYPRWESQATFSLYPTASLFKVVTAAAAFETASLNAESSIRFRGRACSESPGGWGRPRSPRDTSLPLFEAMAHSINPAFGRLARDTVGAGPLLTTAQQFGFGTNPFGTDAVPAGTINYPSSASALMRMAAGLDHDVRTSPFHVAMLFAALGNQGVMPSPTFVDAIRDSSGTSIYQFRPAPLKTIVTPSVAQELLRSMSATVSAGTAKTGFRDPAGRRYREELLVAGKTGTIDGDNPAGHYNWFAGVAPARDPQIAFAAMVVNGSRIKLRAAQLGRAALDIYFAKERTRGAAQPVVPVPGASGSLANPSS